MMEYSLTTHADPLLIEEWNHFIPAQKTGSLFQLPVWSELFNPKTHRWFFFEGRDDQGLRMTALVKARKIPLFGLDCYMDRGPVCDDRSRLKEGLAKLVALLKTEGAIRLTANPYWPYPFGKEIEADLAALGFLPSSKKHSSYFETSVIDLGKNREDIFKDFRKDTRSRIKNSQQKGVRIRPADSEADVKAFYDLFEKMGQKKGMRIPRYGFFLNLWKKVLRDQTLGLLLLATFNDHLMAGIIITTHGLRAVYSWGASDLEFKEKVSKNHLVLWEGILWAKERGFQIFDLGGMTGSKGLDPVMENIDAFKAGFGGQVQQVVRVHNLVLQKSKESVLRLVRT